MQDRLNEELKTLFLAGVGAAAVTAEKTKALVGELVEKGRLICRYPQGARTLRASFSCAILMTFQKIRSDCNEDNLSAPQRLFR